MISLSLLYNRVGTSLLPFCESISLTERLHGKASTLDVTLCNADGRFTTTWAAVKGDALQLRFGDCAPEDYALDRVSVSLMPKTVTWSCSCRPRTVIAPAGRGGGIRPPVSGALVDKRTSWGAIGHVCFRELAAKVAAECGLVLRWLPKANPALRNVVRFNETGFALLSRYARLFGFGIHADASSITITAAPEKTTSPPVTVSLSSAEIERASTASDMAPEKLVSRRFDARSRSVVAFEAGGDGEGAPVVVPFDAADAGALYSDAVREKLFAQTSILPSDRVVAGAIVSIEGASYEVQEMSFTRTGDVEAQSIKAKPV